MPKYSIIIVSYQSESWIEACLKALDRQTYQNFEIILVDNASTDRTCEVVEQTKIEKLQLLRNPVNAGYSGGSNLGALQANGDWLVFLNPDTIARPDWLEQIDLGLARHPGVSAFASAQYELGSKGTLDGAGDAYFGFGIPWRGGFGHSDKALPGEGECFSPCGASAVFKRDLFMRAGGFDESFFCYCEDVDLGFRLRMMGERCVFLPNAIVDHKGSAISGRYSDFTIYHGTRNRMWTYLKNMPAGLLLLTLPGHIAISLYLLVRSLSIGKFKATFRGLRDGLAGIPRIMRARQCLPKPHRQVRIMEAMSWNPNDMRKRRPFVREF